MGVLLGDWEEDNTTGQSIAIVKSISLLRRLDKRKDRVEIAPEQLHLAAMKAEEIENKSGQRTRVIGWYHSHPHITVFPSDVDLNTQLSQQFMDSRFFGLIFSCFVDLPDKSQRTQVTCFQSRKLTSESQPKELRIPLRITKNGLLTLASLDNLQEIYTNLMEEQKEMFLEFFQTDIPSEKLEFSQIYLKTLVNLLNNFASPLIHSIHLKIEHNQREIEKLKLKKEKLTTNGSEKNSQEYQLIDLNDD